MYETFIKKSAGFLNLKSVRLYRPLQMAQRMLNSSNWSYILHEKSYCNLEWSWKYNNSKIIRYQKAVKFITSLNFKIIRIKGKIRHDIKSKESVTMLYWTVVFQMIWYIELLIQGCIMRSSFVNILLNIGFKHWVFFIKSCF